MGVAGRTFTEWCGDEEEPRWSVPPLDMAVETDPLELVDDALECECWWWCWWIDRIDDTDDDVDFRPRRPPEVRRIAVVVRGVSGEGERDCRL